MFSQMIHLIQKPKPEVVIRELLAEVGKEQKGLAEFSGYSTSTVNRYIKGELKTPASFRNKMVEYFTLYNGNPDNIQHLTEMEVSFGR